MESQTQDSKNQAKLFISDAPQDRHAFWTKTLKMSLESFGAPIFRSTLHKKGKPFGRWLSRTYCLYNDKLVYHKNSMVKGFTKLDFVKCTFYPGDQKKQFSFLLEKNGIRTKLYVKDSKTFNEWQKHLRPRVILDDFNEKYREEKLLGKGTNAKVLLVRERTTGDRNMSGTASSSSPVFFAAKELTKNSLKGKALELLYNEIRVLRELDHPNIIKFYEVHEMPKTVNLLMNHVEGGELIELMKAQGCYTEGECAKILKKLLETLLFLQNKKIVHRDIKPQNILVQDKTDSSSIILADFGLACSMEDTSLLRMRCGTPGYMAPEILNNQAAGNYDKIDLFSMGCIFYRMLTGFAPFAGTSADEVAKLNKECKLDFESERLKGVSPAARGLLQKMLEKDPNKRISVKEALNHEFFLPVALELEGKFVNLEENWINGDLSSVIDENINLGDVFPSGMIVRMNLQSVGTFYACNTPRFIAGGNEDPIRLNSHISTKKSNTKISSLSPVSNDRISHIAMKPLKNKQHPNFSQTLTSNVDKENTISELSHVLHSVIQNNLDYCETSPVSLVFFDNSNGSENESDADDFIGGLHMQQNNDWIPKRLYSEKFC